MCTSTTYLLLYIHYTHWVIGASKLLQMDSVHQQHVQTNLDVKKRTTVEKLMHELQADQPEVGLVLV